jgi:hypothetical protein
VPFFIQSVKNKRGLQAFKISTLESVASNERRKKEAKKEGAYFDLTSRMEAWFLS